MSIKTNQLDRTLLVILNTSGINKMKDKYTYLAGFQFSYEDRKYQNVIHMAFEAKDIANIKSDEFLFRKSSSASDRRDTISNDINGKWSQ